MSGGRYELVQPIVATSTGTHEETVRAVAAASMLSAAHVDSPAWVPWLEASFAKSVRRVKGVTQLQRVTEQMAALGHNSFRHECGNVCVEAFAPLPAADLPRPVARLQVSGFDRDRSGCWPEPGVPADVVVVLNGGVPMTTGKAAAQAAHALTGWLLTAGPEEQHRVISGLSSFRLVEQSAELFTQLWPCAAAAIADAGHTEVPPGSRTALAVSLSVFEGMVADEHR